MKTKFNPMTGAYDILMDDVNDVNPSAGTRLKGLYNDMTGFVKAHPAQALATTANASGNVAGLVDNDKVLGQLVGTGLGAAAPKLLGLVPGPIGAFAKGLGGLGIANSAMLGGNLGAMFDILRSKKDQQIANPNYSAHPNIVY